MKTFKLNNSIEIPVLGFGVFQIPQAETTQAVLNALEAGYRHIDTAQSYMNESEVGQALTDSFLPREELFITTKVWLSHYGYDKTYASVIESMKKLQVSYLDLVLLHQPFGDIFGSYRALSDLQKEGKIRAIGVSNFNPERLADLVTFGQMPVQINQIEINPFYQREVDRDSAQHRGNIQLEAWAPFAEGKQGIFTNEILVEIGKKYAKSPAQVILRWNYERGIVSLAKTVKKERMRENLDIFDFELTTEDKAKISLMETSTSQFFKHDDPASVDYFAKLIEERGI